MTFANFLLTFFGLILPWGVVALIAYWSYATFKEYRELIENQNRETREERAQLLDRIMAKDLVDYATARNIIDKPKIDKPKEAEPVEEMVDYGINQI